MSKNLIVIDITRFLAGFKQYKTTSTHCHDRTEPNLQQKIYTSLELKRWECIKQYFRRRE